MVELPKTSQSSQGQLISIKNLLEKCLTSVRNSLGDMLPNGWDLAEDQNLSGREFVLERAEYEHFIVVGTYVFSKDFAKKSQSMKRATISVVSKLVDFLAFPTELTL